MAAGRKNFIFFLCLLDGVQFTKGFATVVLWGVRMTSAELKHRAELQEWAAQIQ